MASKPYLLKKSLVQPVKLRDLLWLIKKQANHMKSRIVKISLWYEDDFANLSKDGKLLFLYLITCPFIELTGIFRFPRQHVLLETGLNDNELKKALIDLEKIKKAFLFKEWIYIPKTEKHNSFSLGHWTGKGFKRELSEIPKDIYNQFNNLYPYYIPTIPLIKQKTENINNKEEDIKQKTVINSSPFE